MSNLCRHCGSPSWRNGPCWWHDQYAERMRSDGYDESNIEAFRKSGVDAPCQFDHYDEHMADVNRREAMSWTAIIAIPVAIIVALYFIF